LLYFFSAVLLSGLEQKHIPYSPYSVKRALENTTLCLDTVDSFAQGHGLLQVCMFPSGGLSLPGLCQHGKGELRNTLKICGCLQGRVPFVPDDRMMV
jgi:hypothetical protein